MSDDFDATIDATPGRIDPPVPSAQPRPASVRPGLRAPRVDGGSLPCVGPELWPTVLAARELFRVARNPRADAQYRHLRPGLEVIRVRLSQALREDPDDNAVADVLAEVIAYLPRREVP